MLLKILNYLFLIGSGYEISEILNSQMLKGYEKETEMLRELFEKASLKGAKNDDIAEVKIIAYATIGIVIGFIAVMLVSGIYIFCRKCARKTVKKALEQP